MLEKQIVQLLSPLVTDVEHLKIEIKRLLSVSVPRTEDVVKSLREDAEFVKSLKGEDGKSVDQEAIVEALKAHVQHGRDGTDGRDGVDGKSIDPDEFVQKYGHQLRGKDGADGRDGKHGIGIKSLTQSVDLRELEIEFDNGEVVTVELPAIKGEKGDTGGTGLGMDAEAWEPGGIYVPNEIVQHHFGRMYRAVSRTTGEPGESADWVRIGQCGIRNTGGFKKDHEYEIGDIYVKDFSTYLWDGKKANLIAARQKETPAIDVARELLEMPRLLDSVIKGLVDPLTEAAEITIKEMVASAVADAQKSPFYKGDDGNWYIVNATEGTAEPLFTKTLLQLISDDEVTDKKPPIRRFAGAWDWNEAYRVGDVVQYGNQLWVCWKPGKHNDITTGFVQMLDSTVIGGSGGGGGGLILPTVPGAGTYTLTGSGTTGFAWVAGTPLPAPPTVSMNEKLINTQAGGLQWVDDRGSSLTVNTLAELYALPQTSLIAGKHVYVISESTTFEYIGTPRSHTASGADWQVLDTTAIKEYASVAQLPLNSATVPPVDGMMAFVRFTANNTPLNQLFRYSAAVNDWIQVTHQAQTKPSGLVQDTQGLSNGDAQYTLQAGHEEIKVADFFGALHSIYSTDNVKAWIAAGNQFQGTVEETGHGVAGAIDLGRLPAESALGASDKSHYWIFVGTAGHVIGGNEVGGATSAIAGQLLNVGDWIIVSGSTPPGGGAEVYQYNVIPGDLLAKSRGDNLYGMNTWTPNAFERGSLVVYNGDLWKASVPVLVTDLAPGQMAATTGAAISAQILGLPLSGVADEAPIDIEVDGGPAASNGMMRVVAAFDGGQDITVSVPIVVGDTATDVASNLETALANAFPANVMVVAMFDTVTVTPGQNVVIDRFSVTVTGTGLVGAGAVNPWQKINLSGGVRKVADDAALAAVTGQQTGDVYLVITSAKNQNKQTLYSWDALTNAWVILGGGTTVALQMSGGARLFDIGLPIGSITMWPTATAPRGWLLCDGATFLQTDYPELAKVLPSLAVPDLRNQFVRGASATRAPLSTEAQATARPTTPFTGRTGTTGNHNHDNHNNSHWGGANTSASGNYSNFVLQQPNPGGGVRDPVPGMIDAGDHNHTFSVTGGGDTETRPANIALAYIIKADDIGVRV